MAPTTDSASTQKRDDVFKPAHQACIFLVDKSFVTNSVVKDTYACKDPKTPGGLVQMVAGLTVPKDYGSNLLVVGQTPDAGNVSAVITKLTQHGYVFYGEDHLAHADLDLDATDLCQNAARMVKEDKHVWNTAGKTAHDTVVVEFLLHDVFGLDTPEDRERTVMYVVCCQKMLGDLYAGKLVICNKVYDIELPEHPTDGLSPRMCPLFLPEANISLPDVPTMDLLLAGDVNRQRNETIQQAYAVENVVRFRHSSVVENVRTSGLLGPAIVCGMKDADAATSLAQSLFSGSSFASKPTSLVASSMADMLRKNPKLNPKTIQARQVPTDQLLAPAVARATLCAYVESQSLAEYDGAEGNVFIRGSLFDGNQFNATQCAMHTTAVSSPRSILNKIHIATVTDKSKDKSQQLSMERLSDRNATCWSLEPVRNDMSCDRVFARSVGYNPHLVYRLLWDWCKYLKKAVVAKMMTVPCAEQRPFKGVVTANLHNPTLLGNHLGPLGNCDYSYGQMDVDSADQLQRGIMQDISNSAKMTCQAGALPAVFDHEHRLDPNLVISDLCNLVTAAGEKATKTIGAILDRGEENGPLPINPGARVKADYIMRCGIRPAQANICGPILGHIINATFIYRLKVLVATKLCKDIYNTMQLSADQVVCNLPSLDKLVASKYFDQNWSLTLAATSSSVSYDLPRANATDVEMCAGIYIPFQSMTHKKLTLKASIVDRWAGRNNARGRPKFTAADDIAENKILKTSNVASSLLCDTLEKHEISPEEGLAAFDSMMKRDSYASRLFNTLARACDCTERATFIERLDGKSLFGAAYTLSLLNETALSMKVQPKSVEALATTLYEAMLMRKLATNRSMCNIRDTYKAWAPMFATFKLDIQKRAKAGYYLADSPMSHLTETGVVITDESFNYFTRTGTAYVSARMDNGINAFHVRATSPELVTNANVGYGSHIFYYIMSLYDAGVLPRPKNLAEGLGRSKETLLMETVSSLFSPEAVADKILREYGEDIFATDLSICDDEETLATINTICEIVRCFPPYAEAEAADIWSCLCDYVCSVSGDDDSEGPPPAKQAKLD